MKIGIVILGVGRWGIHWVRNFLLHPQANLVAIVDTNPARLAECKQQFSLDENQVILATDWEKVRQLPNIDAVVIATPATTHYPLILDALKLGYHVLAEKPLTLNPLECLELTRLAEEKRLQLFIDHTYLFHPAVEKGKQIIQAEKLGELRYGYASRTHLGPVRQDVDALWDLAIHDICIFNHWLGQTPIQVEAKGDIWLQPDKKVLNFQGLADLVWVTLTYPDGFRAYIHLCWLNTDKQRRLSVVGSQGSLIFDEMSQESPLSLQHGYFQQQGEHFLPTNQSREVISIEAAEPLKRVCHCFLESIFTASSCYIASGFLATQLVEILTALSLSLKRQGEVILVNSKQ